MSSADEKQAQVRRLFFALWPEEVIRRKIIVRREALVRAGRPVPVHNLHLTLLFLGNRPAEELPAIMRGADKITSRAFELVLDRFGWFARAQVAWLGGLAPSVAQELVEALAVAMDDDGVGYDQRPWTPHVTLLRKVARRPAFPRPEPLIWRAGEFALVESLSGQPYRVLRTWPLC